MTRMSPAGYVSVPSDRFLKPFVRGVPWGCAKGIKELVWLVWGPPASGSRRWPGR